MASSPSETPPEFLQEVPPEMLPRLEPEGLVILRERVFLLLRLPHLLPRNGKGLGPVNDFVRTPHRKVCPKCHDIWGAGTSPLDTVVGPDGDNHM